MAHAAITVQCHIRKDSGVSINTLAVPGEPVGDTIVLALGDSPAEVRVFLTPAGLVRLADAVNGYLADVVRGEAA